MTKRQMKINILMTLVVMVIILAAFSSSTYAWFTFNASTNVEPISSAVSKGESLLLISNDRNGSFEKSCTLILNHDVEIMRPVSTVDLSRFFTASGHNSDGISIFYKEVENPDEVLMHGTVYLKSVYGDSDVYFYTPELSVANRAQLIAALRLALRVTTADGQTNTWIFSLDPLREGMGNVESVVTTPVLNSVISSVNGDSSANFVGDPSVSIGSYLTKNGTDFTAGDSKLCTIMRDEIAVAEYWLYLEGCDENCMNDIRSSDIDFELAFAGVTVSEK